MLLMFMCALIPTIVLGLLSYHKSAEIVNDQLDNYNKYAMKQLKLLLDTHLREMDSIARDTLAYLLVPSREIVIEPQNYQQHLELNRFIEYLNLHLSPLIEGLFIVTPDGRVIGNRHLHYEKLLQTEWWADADDRSRWIGFHSAEYYAYPAPEGPLMSLVMPIQLDAALPPGSIILVDVNAGPLTELFLAFEEDTRSFLEITGESGETIYRTARPFEGSDDDLVWTEVLDVNGWRLKARIAHAEYLRTAKAIRTYALLVSGAALLISLILAQLFSRNFARRIIRLNKSMLEVSQGKLDTTVDVQGHDELSRLASRFNYMTQQIRSLIESISIQEQQKREAELRALHYQINPHLLLNTLNMIQWQARISGQKDIDAMIYHLTEVLAESLAARQELIPLSHEIKTLSHYLQIQKYRFGDVFMYEEEIESGLEDVLVPRMTLQPLVENIFYHAFEDGRGSIRLACRRVENGVLLTLADDGAGFLTAGREGKEGDVQPFPPRKGRGGLGLYNVDQKIRLHFGEPYGLTVHSEPGAGTEIRILLPLRKEEDEG